MSKYTICHSLSLSFEDEDRLNNIKNIFLIQKKKFKLSKFISMCIRDKETLQKYMES